MHSVWAAGTGYGTGDRTGNQDPIWDAAASELAQRARDEELRHLLESLVADVARDLKMEPEPVASGGYSHRDKGSGGPGEPVLLRSLPFIARCSFSRLPFWSPLLIDLRGSGLFFGIYFIVVCCHVRGFSGFDTCSDA